MLKKVLSEIFLTKANVNPVAMATPMVVSQRPSDKDEPDGARNDAAEKWRDSILGRFYQCMHLNENNNFDSERFAGQDPALFHIDYPVNYLKFFFLNFINLFEARTRLADNASQELLDRLILYRLLSHHHVRVLDDSAAH